jgi:hypothetical protein
MFRAVKIATFLLWLILAVEAAAQSSYQVVPLTHTGTIAGTVTWSGPLPRIPTFSIDKDPEICDPESHRTRDLERLIVGPRNGVANTVVFLKDISRGKAMDIPETRRFQTRSNAATSPTSC